MPSTTDGSCGTRCCSCGGGCSGATMPTAGASACWLPLLVLVRRRCCMLLFSLLTAARRSGRGRDGRSCAAAAVTERCCSIMAAAAAAASFARRASAAACCRCTSSAVCSQPGASASTRGTGMSPCSNTNHPAQPRRPALPSQAHRKLLRLQHQGQRRLDSCQGDSTAAAAAVAAAAVRCTRCQQRQQAARLLLGGGGMQAVQQGSLSYKQGGQPRGDVSAGSSTSGIRHCKHTRNSPMLWRRLTMRE